MRTNYGISHHFCLGCIIVYQFNDVIKKSKYHKAESDDISVEILKNAEYKVWKPMLFQLIVQIWASTQIPNSVLQLIMCSIYKKGGTRLCKNLLNKHAIISVFYETFNEFVLKFPINKTEIILQKAYENEQRS